jgi:hypothetical protein
MKRLLLLVLGVGLIFSLEAQSFLNLPDQQETGVDYGPTPENATEIMNQFHRNYQNNTSTNGRAVSVTFPLDYDGVEATYANVNGLDYDRVLVRVNRNFTQDSTRVMKWVTQTYDTLIDYVTNPIFPFNSYPYATTQVTIDSLNFIYGHINNSGNNDTLVVSIFDGNGLTTIGADSGLWGNATLLWSDTIITDTSLTGPGSQPGTISLGVYSAPVGIALSQGQTFAMQLDYFGPLNDPFYSYTGFRDDCAAACVAEPSVIESRFGENSIGRYVTNTFTTFTPNVYFDCDNDNAPTPGGCESYFVQNLIVNPILTAQVELNVTASADVTAGCSGTPVNLQANVVGASGNPTYLWTGAVNGQLSANNIANPQYTIGDASDVLTVRVIDGGDTAFASINMTSNHIEVNAGADQSIPCGSTANLVATATGDLVGITYSWSNGVNGFANNGVTAGSYTVTVSNAAGCSDNDNVRVTYPNVNQSVAFNPPTPACAGASQEYTNVSTRVSGWTWTWDFNNGDLRFGSSTQNYTWSAPGNYTVQLSGDSAGCVVDGNPQTVTVLPSTDPACAGNGIEDVLFGASVNIFPNPATDVVNIEVNGLEEDLHVTIMDITGRVVFEDVETSSSNYSKAISLGDYSTGIYLVRLTSGDKEATKKIQINK